LRGGCDAVLAPAEDGGYALIGVSKGSAALFSALFSGIAWGGADVYAKTVEKLGLAGYRWRVLRTVWDLDRPADLDSFRGPAPQIAPLFLSPVARRSAITR